MLRNAHLLSPEGDTGRRRAVGVLVGASAAVLWGSQFPVAKPLFATVDPYTLVAIRYGIASLIFLAALLLIEGSASLRYEGHFRRSLLLGSTGVTGGVLLVFVGLEHARSQEIALVVGTQPLLTALVNRLLGGPRLRPITLVAIVVALLGVLLVITRGHPASLANGEIGWGVPIAAFGQFWWALYTIETGRYPGWSPLRITALTAWPGGLTVAAIAVIAASAGWTHPAAEAIWDARGALVYIVLVTTVFAVFAWNFARLRIGAQNTSLFMNLVPVSTFAIETARGYRPNTAELAGAALVIAALVANNILLREPRGAKDSRLASAAGERAASPPNVSRR